MTALIRTRGSTSELARLFDAAAAPALKWKPFCWPGDPVPVVTGDDRGRTLSTMAWGLPLDDFRRPLAPAQRAGLFASDLMIDASRLRDVLALERSLIIIESYACPVGSAGAMTREWTGLSEEPLTAWAGFCNAARTHCAGLLMRTSASLERGNAPYPRLLRREYWQAWLDGAGFLSIGEPYEDTDLYREDLGERWSNGRQDAATLPLFAA